MEFFTTSDWLGREGPFLYHPEYLAYFAFATAVAIVLPILLRRVKLKTAERVMIYLWLAELIYDVSKWCISWTETIITGGGFEVGSGLPFHTCSTFWYTAPLALFLKEGKLKTALMSYVCTVNLFGGIVGMFLGTAMMYHYSFISYYGSQMMIYHSMLIILPMIMLVTGYYKPKVRDIFLGFAVFAAIATPMFVFDSIFKVDYMYIYDGSTLEPFKHIAAVMPHRLLWTLIAVLGYFGIVALFTLGAIGIRRLCENIAKKRADRAVTDGE